MPSFFSFLMQNINKTFIYLISNQFYIKLHEIIAINIIVYNLI